MYPMKIKTIRYRTSVTDRVKVFYILCLLFSISLTVMVLKKDKNHEEYNLNVQIKLEKLLNDTKRILLWTPPNCVDCAPFAKFRKGYDIFRTSKCKYQNCFVESSLERVLEVDEYDAIVFNGRPILRMTREDLPQKRDRYQRYIFLQKESENRFPVCQEYYDDFFNWTLTYRLDSDIPWPYVSIKNFNNETIGPRVDMVWEQNMMPISDDLKEKLKSKTKLVAWFVSNCYDRSGRLKFALQLRKELERYNETLDIYGRCGELKCPRSDSSKCEKYIERDYKFYLAFENSFSEDYITEKLLTAVLHDAVPIVYGGADYERFLPPNSYIDARLFSAEELAKTMVEHAKNLTLYFSHFEWRNHYYFEDTNKNGEMACDLCARLNEDHLPSQHKDFRKWWSKDYQRRC